MPSNIGNRAVLNIKNRYGNNGKRKNVSRETFKIKKGSNLMEICLHCLAAFAVGGAICLIGQVLIDYTKLTPARILVCFVVSGVILTALGLYEPLVKLAGAGATVPLTGFGYSLAKGVEKAVAQYGIYGALTGGLTATAGGITAAMVSGLLMSLIFKPGDKN